VSAPPLTLNERLALVEIQIGELILRQERTIEQLDEMLDEIRAWAAEIRRGLEDLEECGR
jgi:uncharacterized coiled-coil protein SlyX